MSHSFPERVELSWAELWDVWLPPFDSESLVSRCRLGCLDWGVIVSETVWVGERHLARALWVWEVMDLFVEKNISLLLKTCCIFSDDTHFICMMQQKVIDYPKHLTEILHDVILIHKSVIQNLISLNLSQYDIIQRWLMSQQFRIWWYTWTTWHDTNMILNHFDKFVFNNTTEFATIWYKCDSLVNDSKCNNI